MSNTIVDQTSRHAFILFYMSGIVLGLFYRCIRLNLYVVLSNLVRIDAIYQIRVAKATKNLDARIRTASGPTIEYKLRIFWDAF